MQSLCLKVLLLLFCLSLFGCSGDDSKGTISYMTALINGERIEFRTDPAKVFAGTDGALTLIGKNCTEGRQAIRLDVPQVTGRHNLRATGGAKYYTGAAFACPGETGTSTQWRTLEATVEITSLSDTFITGSFDLLADNPNPEWPDTEIVGEFEIRIE